ncbi:MAG TPA: BadF/BadG/BcrA/BcrD ATPase family protein [Amycolatopsis sp.]|uniref:N-acetylglucosamine kinase n=1 Tax=Amycolatopsis sp. TaxID=37632 RepID=UPI002B4A65EE|nr:BadF/BadG/BcrA/BcrD ATPase family protein [Amycolatopsis sp.]HKS45092.1 BadF/BadG/BcrA/BcrD ATPase family protein [Amycolatopsis sp.]
MTRFVVGVDAGGTSTRALAVAEDGTVLGSGGSGGANPNSHPPEQAAARIGEAVAAALGDLDPRQANACVVGMAGSSKLTDPAIAALFEATWQRLGLAKVGVLSDAEAAFASATSAPDGTVLVAGTGSIAGRIRKRRMVSTAGGYGWLLGDEGSGFWLGREAVRRALDELSRGATLGALSTAVLAEAGVDAGDRMHAWRRLITVVNGEPPIRLARFAPLVSGSDDAGEIIDRAAALLAETAMATREPGEDTPVVLVGSVLSGPVGAKVRDKLAGIEVHASSDGVLGAAWLAAVDAYGETARRPEQRV